MSRKKLIKLLGKEVRYTATIDTFGADKMNVCITNLRHKGKFIADHTWLHMTRALEGNNPGDVVSFYGTARTYTDRQGKRKRGLHRCYDFTIHDEAYETAIAEEFKNIQNKRNS